MRRSKPVAFCDLRSGAGTLGAGHFRYEGRRPAPLRSTRHGLHALGVSAPACSVERMAGEVEGDRGCSPASRWAGSNPFAGGQALGSGQIPLARSRQRAKLVRGQSASWIADEVGRERVDAVQKTRGAVAVERVEGPAARQAFSERALGRTRFRSRRGGRGSKSFGEGCSPSPRGSAASPPTRRSSVRRGAFRGYLPFHRP